MKLFKKMMTFVLAAIMTVALGATNVYAEDKNLTVPNETGHTYEVFQIFTGDLADGKLSNIKWGANGKETAGTAVSETILTSLKNIGTSTADPAKVDAILAALGMAKTDLDDTKAFKKDVAAGTVLTVPTGYYIIKDQDGSQANKDNAYSLLMIDVVGDVALEAKMAKPTVEKKVDDVNDSTGAKTTLKDSADYDIGDAVPFTLTATLANNVSSYKKYHITFVDTLESGKFSAISALTIKVDGTPVADVTGYNASITGYAGDVPPTVAGFTQTIEFTPATGETFLPAALNGKKVTIEFNATLGTGAAIGKAGNKNEVELEYSNNPNDDQGGEEGKTPKDTVRVFTYKLTINKVDENKAALTGANFTLFKKVKTAAEGETQIGQSGETIKSGFDSSVKAGALQDEAYYVEVGQKTGDATGDTFSFNGIDDGTYVLVETTIPAGYNAWDAKEFVVEAEHQLDAADPQLTKLTGGDLVSGDFKDTGIIITSIENKSGSTLPSTGGIGTTIFYVLGGLLVAGAGIVLVARKKASE